MTCEFRFGAPSWGTGGPEFKSRRSDQKFTNKSKDLGPVPRFRRKTEITNKSGIKRRNKTKTTAVLGAKQQRTNIEGHTLAMAKRRNRPRAGTSTMRRHKTRLRPNENPVHCQRRDRHSGPGREPQALHGCLGAAAQTARRRRILFQRKHRWQQAFRGLAVIAGCPSLL